jgi:hypothetical protein
MMKPVTQAAQLKRRSDGENVDVSMPTKRVKEENVEMSALPRRVELSAGDEKPYVFAPKRTHDFSVVLNVKLNADHRRLRTLSN